ncbi:MAG: 6-pyruvoyl-tetrahydropterin synthase-related protein [Candidatus Parcubacteria bacterium]|nr:6-pyruvoyl-tetrahydropterin synthase-related protein [Candidatus Parcubacteria bacterium]
MRKGSYESGDINIHAGFAISFYETLKDGNFIPRWNSDIIYGYGYPLFIFAYPLPYYLTAFFHFLGFSFISSIKIILGLSFIASGITMFFFIKEELKNKYAAFAASIIYLFSPYHLVDLHFRVALGENISFAILPFCFFSIKRMFQKPTFAWTILSGVSLALLILSHQAISLTSFPFIIIYCLYLLMKKKNTKIKSLFSYISFLAMGLSLSSFYWIPAIFESKYINLLSHGNISFIGLNQLFYSPWKWGFLFQGPQGELSLMVGYAQWLIIILSIILFISNRISLKEKGIYSISIISFFALLVMTQSISNPIWMNTSLLRGFQFSYRLLLCISFFTSIIAGIVIKNFTQKWFLIGLCLITISITFLNWGNRKTLPQLTDAAIQYEFPKSMAKVGQGTTIWVDSNKFESDKRMVPHIDILQGNASISETSRNSTKHKYSISVLSKTAMFKENTLYFPNWVVKVDNEIYPISFTDPMYPGVITFSLNKGPHIVEVIFMDTSVRIFSMFLSGLTFLGILIYAFASKKLNSPKI